MSVLTFTFPAEVVPPTSGLGSLAVVLATSEPGLAAELRMIVTRD